jgi:hypothetical protein
MNRHELHEALTRLAELDHSPTPAQLAAFRDKATRQRVLRRSVTVGVVCVLVLVVGGAVALADRSSSPRVVVPADPTPTSVVPSAPTTVTAIGDGVMLGAADPLAATIDAMRGTPTDTHLTNVDAAESRQFADGIDVLQGLKDAGTLGRAVIVHLGTNGTVAPADFDRMMDLLADREKVIIVNTRVPRPWEDQVNETLAAGVEHYENTVLVDWHAYGLAHPELFYDDDIHLRPEGADAYASLLAAALGTARPPGDPAATTTTTTGTSPGVQHLAPPTNRVPSPAAGVQEQEGVWQPTGRLVDGRSPVYTTFVRPDAIHTSYFTGLMWLDTTLLDTNYVVGVAQPGGGANPWGSQIPLDEQASAIAAFNGGMKMDSAQGGAYLDGQEIVPLRPGAASLVIHQDGSASVGAWGRDFDMSSDVKAVRQNLVLIVDDGHVNPDLAPDDTVAFGATLGNNVYVWRSGVGVTADGALVYAGGPALSIVSLARTLQAAGAVRAMALDLNTDWVSAYTYRTNASVAGASLEGVKLLDNMAHDGNWYLQPNGHDFFAFTAKPDAVVSEPTSPTQR